MSMQQKFIVIAVIEAILIFTAIVLSIFVFPPAGGGVNLMILLPMIFVSSMLPTGFILYNTMQSKGR